MHGVSPRCVRIIPTEAGSPCLFLMLVALLACLPRCHRDKQEQAKYFEVPEIGLALPMLSGWKADDTVHLEDPAKGGVARHLVRDGSIPGSPRIDVVLAPLEPRPTKLETFLAENLRKMAAMENAGQIRILEVIQDAVRVGPRRAFKVRHEYTLGAGDNLASITQIALLLVLDGRGVAVVALGRTELVYPLADSIDRMLGGVVLRGDDHEAAAPPEATNPQQPQVPGKIQPVDLGRIGGK